MKTKRFTLRLDEEALTELQRLAELNNRTMSDVVRLLITLEHPVHRGSDTYKVFSWEPFKGEETDTITIGEP